MTHSAPPMVLVAEDDALIRDLIDYKLTAEGFRVVTYSNGADVLQNLGAELPNAVILDGMLPGVDGLEVLRALKQAPETADIPVIMLTGRDAEDDVVGGLELGAADYITKPFSPNELVARVRRALRETPS